MSLCSNFRGILVAILLVTGCQSPPEERIEATSSSGYITTRASLSISRGDTEASPSPLATAGLDEASARAAEADTDQAHLHFTWNLQWYTPADWIDTGDKWITPDQILVKSWNVPEKGELSADIVTALLCDHEIMSTELDEPPTPVIQGDFRLWTASGTGKKRNEKKEIEAVDWAACIVEPLKPVKETDHTIFVTTGPRGESEKCVRTLRTLTDTIDHSSGGATPTTIEVNAWWHAEFEAHGRRLVEVTRKMKFATE